MAIRFEIENLIDRRGKKVQYKDKELRENVDELISIANTAVETAEGAVSTANEASEYVAGVEEYVDAKAEAAAGSAESAAADARVAETSASAAAGSAATAAESASSASSYATSAESSAGSASDSAAAASASATLASNNAGAAASSAEAANTSAASAASSVNDAQAQATAAANSATDAAGSATDAAGSATAAANSATAAAGSASDAADSASDAEQTLTDVQAVAASIPEDYTELSADVDDLKSAFAIDVKSDTTKVALGTLTSGKYILKSTGGANNSSAWSVSGYIPIHGNRLFFTCPHSTNNTQLNNIAAIAYYAGQNQASYLSSNSVSIRKGTLGTYEWVLTEVPDGASFMRVTIPTETASSYEIYEGQPAPISYYVSKETISPTSKKAPDSASITELLLRLKDDHRQKTIYIDGGDYDIFQEYADLRTAGLLPSVPQSDYDPSTGYVPYNVFIPDNTHIIGLGYVKLIYMPNAVDTNANESKTISPINVAGSMTLENVEIHCKNGRYCIHDDPIQDAAYTGAIKTYKNVKCVKYDNDTGLGYRHCFGCGIAREMTYIFDNCMFDDRAASTTSRTFYFHDRREVGGVTLTDEMSSRIIAKDCVFLSAAGVYGVFLGNIGAALHIRVDLDNCYTNAAIVAADEGDSSTGSNTNSYDITLLFCKYANLVIRDANNPYTPTIYAY